MRTINDLKPGTYFIYRGEPHEVLEASHLKMAQSKGMLQVKVRNMKTGGVFSDTFKGNDRFEDADIQSRKLKFIYSHRGNFIFSEAENSSRRLELTEEAVGDGKYYLTPNLVLGGIYFDGTLLTITFPPKVELRVKDAPPVERGNTAQGGKKPVVAETGLKVQVPFFIKGGDLIIVNTNTGEYVERAK